MQLLFKSVKVFSAVLENMVVGVEIFFACKLNIDFNHVDFFFSESRPVKHLS